ncbi:MAG: PRC-barrel domain-containing protein, partial [Bacteroidota bacterium]|nr:PRC-barrel domain-containing protein [Bacteroidota bacterium]
SFTESFKNEHAAALQRLKDMEDFTVADDDPDVRGWKVKGSNGETIGKVDELIVDTQSMKVRYLDIDLDNNLLDGDKERHLLIPIGVAKIDEDHDDVLVPTLDGNMARKIPSYSGKEVTRDYEQTLLTTLSPEYNTALHQNENFYENKHFDDSKFYRSKKRK